MAKSKNGTGSQARPLALELLETDHRTVEALFAQYEKDKEADEDIKRALAQRICGELTVHAQVEEELFYPWLRENLEDDKMELVEEAYVEHASAKDLIAQIEGGGEIDEAFDAKVKVLSEYIKHHVKEEEGEIFKELRGMAEDLDELGQEMHARKAELMEDLGLTSEQGAMPMAAALSGKGSRASSQRAR